MCIRDRALKAAIKAKDIALLRGALEQTLEIDMSYTDLPQKAQLLLDKLLLLVKTQDKVSVLIVLRLSLIHI